MERRMRDEGRKRIVESPAELMKACWPPQVAPVVKNPPANAGRPKRHRFDPWVGKIPCRRAWQPTPVFSSGESHGQWDLESYGPQGHTESDTTEAT